MEKMKKIYTLAKASNKLINEYKVSKKIKAQVLFITLLSCLLLFVPIGLIAYAVLRYSSALTFQYWLVIAIAAVCIAITSTIGTTLYAYLMKEKFPDDLATVNLKAIFIGEFASFYTVFVAVASFVVLTVLL